MLIFIRVLFSFLSPDQSVSVWFLLFVKPPELLSLFFVSTFMYFGNSRAEVSSKSEKEITFGFLIILFTEMQYHCYLALVPDIGLTLLTQNPGSTDTCHLSLNVFPSFYVCLDKAAFLTNC